MSMVALDAALPLAGGHLRDSCLHGMLIVKWCWLVLKEAVLDLRMSSGNRGGWKSHDWKGSQSTRHKEKATGEPCAWGQCLLLFSQMKLKLRVLGVPWRQSILPAPAWSWVNRTFGTCGGHFWHMSQRLAGIRRQDNKEVAQIRTRPGLWTWVHEETPLPGQPVLDTWEL